MRHLVKIGFLLCDLVADLFYTIYYLVYFCIEIYFQWQSPSKIRPFWKVETPLTFLQNFKRIKIKKLIGLTYQLFVKAPDNFNPFLGPGKWK